MRKNSSSSDLILLALEKAVDGYVRFEDFAYNTHIYARGYDRPLKKSSLAQALRRLRLKGYLDLDYFNNQIIYKLTERGKSEAILRKILQDETWDGKWRIVVFDIPEENRKVRNILRSKLKSWKFVPWQKSVWAGKKKVTDHLRRFVKEVRIEKWVLIIESDNIG